MKAVRITINMLLSGILIAGSLYLLSVETYVFRSTLFTGASRYLLAACLALLAGFAGAIALGWIRGRVPAPRPHTHSPIPGTVDPTYQGELIVRYWYFILPAAICLALAFVLAAPASA